MTQTTRSCIAGGSSCVTVVGVCLWLTGHPAGSALDLDGGLARAGRSGRPARGGIRRTGGLARRIHGAIFAYWRSKSSSRISPIWMDRMIPSPSMKYVWGRPATR